VVVRVERSLGLKAVDDGQWTVARGRRRRQVLTGEARPRKSRTGQRPAVVS
jgi:hypothetical protein